MGYLDYDGLETQVGCIKRYVQAKLAEYLPKSGGTIDGNLTVSGTITGNVTGTASGNLPLSGGTLTGAVNGVTPTAGDNSTKLATTAFVQGELSKAVYVDSYTPGSGGRANFSVNLPSHGLYFFLLCTASSSETGLSTCLVDTTTSKCFKSMLNGGASYDGSSTPSVSGTEVSVKLSSMSGKTAYVYYMRIGNGANPS